MTGRGAPLLCGLAATAAIAASAARPSANGPTGAYPGRVGLVAYATGEAAVVEILTVHPDSGARRRLVRGGDASYNGTPSWSPDGRTLAFSSRGGGRSVMDELYTVRADGTGRRRLTNNRVDDFDPSWSPDGTAIVFVHDAPGPGMELRVMPARGGPSRRALRSPRDLDGPAWSPDGRRIAYGEHGPRGTSTIYTVSAEGRRRTRVAAGETPSWSPDGSRLAYASDRNDIVVSLPSGRRARAVYHDAGHPAWSPDGERLAFDEVFVDPESWNTFSFAVAVIGADGSGYRRLPPEYAEQPDWQPLCTVRGTARRDVLVGTGGDDLVCGFGGADVLRGGRGDDVLLGGDGDDVLEGGPGRDRLFGGYGDDVLRPRPGDGDVVLAGPGG